MSTAPRPRPTALPHARLHSRGGTPVPEDLTRRLTAWLAPRLPGARVTGVTVPASNGMSSETLLFDLDHPGPGSPGLPAAPEQAAVPGSCVLRLAADPAAYTIFPRYDMPRQYRTMRLVADRTDLPVPRTLWLEEDPAHLGAPFFVMARAAGRVPPDVMPYTYEGNWLHDATDAERDRLEAASVSVLARLHDQLPAESAEFLAFPGTGSPLRRHVDAQHAYYTWVVDGLPRSPLIERGFAWLADHWPEDTGGTVLSWGDARIGNIVYDGFEPAAILDWEMAAPGPRELDLGWMIYLHRFFQDLTESSGQRGLPDLLRRDRVESRYAALTGHRPRAMEFYTLYAALRHAIVMLRVAYRQVHFDEGPVPDDPDGLILHRDTLEAMLAGHYW
ncbi:MULTISPECIES: phosphotransferase family protein [unclassified Streptomyces]|uniref:phosphotransferase family protein n=1 Tax=unclassified Streptomyces TaxID=2593676 RepID=UPI00036B884F|nr:MULTISPECIES: phosphotransferase family protein [unclassified Streptomyces]MYT27309.1 phosphotransferase [Streptomyces sp. SID8354]